MFGLLLAASYLRGFYEAPRPDSTEESTQTFRHSRRKSERRGAAAALGADLRVDQSVVEKDEPVDGEAAGVLQRQRFVAALADQPALGLPQRVLATRKRSAGCRGDRTHKNTLADAYRHFTGKALPEVEGVLCLLPPPLQLEAQSFKLGAAVLQLPVVLRVLKDQTRIGKLRLQVALDGPPVPLQPPLYPPSLKGQLPNAPAATTQPLSTHSQ